MHAVNRFKTMPTFKDTSTFQAFIASQRTSKTSIGFVPTMGALHKGHISLAKQAASENELVVVSIFVNPTQFGNAGDLKKYPRTLIKDENLLKTLQNDIIIFAPEPEDLYNGEVISKSYNFGSIATEMEGRYRKGHFDGVGTVLELLFNVVKPTNAYFGEKDFQQLQIVRKLVTLTKQSINIIGCDIFRERNGLAMSSRNQRLTENERQAAGFIYEILSEVKTRFELENPKNLTKWVEAQFREHPLLDLEYFEIADIKNLKTVSDKQDGANYRAFIAAFLNEIRLIDNVPLNY